MEGQIVEIALPSGTVIKSLNGLGRITTADTMTEGVFETSMADGMVFKLNGYGRYISRDVVYEGWWTNGLRNGYGKQLDIAT